MIFSSDPICSLHNLKMECFHVNKKLLQCSGDPSVKYHPAPSLIINRYRNDDVSNAQTFIPLRYLYGLVPTAILESYNFWQNADDSLTGYMPINNKSNTARSILRIDLAKTGHPDSSGFGLSSANAVVSRIITLEDPTIKDLDFYTVPDPDKPTMFLVNILRVLGFYHQQYNNEDTPVGPRSSNNELGKDKPLLIWYHVFHCLVN